MHQMSSRDERGAQILIFQFDNGMIRNHKSQKRHPSYSNTKWWYIKTECSISKYTKYIYISYSIIVRIT